MSRSRYAHGQSGSRALGRVLAGAVVLAALLFTPQGAPAQSAPAARVLSGAVQVPQIYSVSDDGARAIFMGRGKILVDVDAGTTRRIDASGPRSDAGVAISGDGRLAGYSVFKGRGPRMKLGVALYDIARNRRKIAWDYQLTGAQQGASTTGRYLLVIHAPTPAQMGGGDLNNGILDTKTGAFARFPATPKRYSGAIAMALSADGNWALYRSSRYDHPDLWYLYSRRARKTKFIGIEDQVLPSMSYDGSLSFFPGVAGTENNDVPQPLWSLYDRRSGTFTGLLENSFVLRGFVSFLGAMSGDGQLIAFVCGNGLYAYNRMTDTYSQLTSRVPSSGELWSVVISRDGRRVFTTTKHTLLEAAVVAGLPLGNQPPDCSSNP